MHNTLHSTARRSRTFALLAGGTSERPKAARRAWFNPLIGFWVGGIVLGAAGCLLGAFMPYRQPVAVAVSVLWWGVYLGCFGASVGALIALFTENTPAPPSQRGNDFEDPRTQVNNPLFPAGDSGVMTAVSRIANDSPPHRTTGIPAGTPGR
jgi:hypothetical protein